MQPPHGTNADSAVSDGLTLDDLRREVGDRWDIAPITGGYRAIIREPGGTPIPRYGRTPAEVLESIRHLERRP